MPHSPGPIGAPGEAGRIDGRSLLALQRLSNVPVLIDRSRYPLPALGFAERAYARWLFVLRRNPDFCRDLGSSYGRARLDGLVAILFGPRDAPCEVELPDEWWRVSRYEMRCGALWKSGPELAVCLDEADQRIPANRQ
jgi:hypothetical protein